MHNLENRELAALVLKAQSGDRDAFTTLFYETRYVAFAAARGVLNHDSQAVEDVVSETFITVWTKIRQLKKHSAFKGWLGQIARNKALNFYRRNKDRPTESDSPVFLSLEDHRETGEVEVDERIELLLSEMPNLNDISREALDYFYLRDMSCIEASDELGLNMSTFKRRVFQGRNQLRELVGVAG